jgi:hypothetical protein
MHQKQFQKWMKLTQKSNHGTSLSLLELELVKQILNLLEKSTSEPNFKGG